MDGVIHACMMMGFLLELSFATDEIHTALTRGIIPTKMDGDVSSLIAFSIIGAFMSLNLVLLIAQDMRYLKARAEYRARRRRGAMPKLIVNNDDSDDEESDDEDSDDEDSDED